MFKKRNRPVNVRDKAIAIQEDENGASGSGTSHDGDEGQTVEELKLLRKLKKQQQGIDLEKLNRGEVIKEKVEEVSYGLQKRPTNIDENPNDRMARMIRSNNFTEQTNSLDVDKHMMKYIEEEFAKRRGLVNNQEKSETVDPETELYKIAERYDLEKRKEVEKKKKADEIGSVTNSLGMLTSIPEVDLGMENRLKNIEATERAKRELAEKRKVNPTRRRPEEMDYASTRFKQPIKIESDEYIVENAKRQKAGLPPLQPPRPRDDKHETATDEALYERFKKRMKK